MNRMETERKKAVTQYIEAFPDRRYQLGAYKDGFEAAYKVLESKIDDLRESIAMLALTCYADGLQRQHPELRAVLDKAVQILEKTEI